MYIDHAHCSEASDKLNESRDCTVRAIACATNTTYADTHAACALEGRQNGSGMRTWEWQNVTATLGYTCVDVRSWITGSTVKQILPQLNTHARYILQMRGHVACVKHGEIHDWLEVGRRHQIKQIFMIVSGLPATGNGTIDSDIKHQITSRELWNIEGSV